MLHPRKTKRPKSPNCVNRRDPQGSKTKERQSRNQQAKFHVDRTSSSSSSPRKRRPTFVQRRKQRIMCFTRVSTTKSATSSHCSVEDASIMLKSKLSSSTHSPRSQQCSLGSFPPPHPPTLKSNSIPQHISLDSKKTFHENYLRWSGS